MATGQKSMFDGKAKPPTPQDFQQRVQEVEDRRSSHKTRAAELFLQFDKIIKDKTVPQNRNVFNVEAEREVLQNLMRLASEINLDENEEDGIGSLTLITFLFKACLAQRDRINEMEFAVSVLQKKLDSPTLAEYINKEITKALDKKKISG